MFQVYINFYRFFDSFAFTLWYMQIFFDVNFFVLSMDDFLPSFFVVYDCLPIPTFRGCFILHADHGNNGFVAFFSHATR